MLDCYTCRKIFRLAVSKLLFVVVIQLQTYVVTFARNEYSTNYFPSILDTIQPIQLAGLNEIGNTFEGRMATVIGWGKDQSSGYGTKRLKYADIMVISNSECAMTWAITPKKHVCTAADSGEDACQVNELSQIMRDGFNFNESPLYLIPFLKNISNLLLRVLFTQIVIGIMERLFKR